MSNQYKIETKCIQSGWKPKKGEPRVLPIYQSTTFKYDKTDEMGKLFDLEEEGYCVFKQGDFSGSERFNFADFAVNASYLVS